MKKSLLALAVLGAFAGAASAQSSVTHYGTVDLFAGRYNDAYRKADEEMSQQMGGMMGGMKIPGLS